MGLMDQMRERMEAAAATSGHPVNRWEAMAEQMLATLEQISERITQGQGRASQDEYRASRAFSIQTNANGNGDAIIELPPGTAWDLQTYAFQVNDAAPTGYLAFYRDAMEDGTALLRVAEAAMLVDDNFGQGSYIPGQTGTILAAARGLPAGVLVRGRVYARAFTTRATVHTDVPNG